MIRPEAIIFDMDGVLIDSEPIHIEIERKLFNKLGVEVSAEIHKTYLGTAGDFMYSDLKRRFGLTQSLEELLVFDDLFRCEYFKSLDNLKPNIGVTELLGELRQSGLKLAVATSSTPELAGIILNRCKIHSYFDVVVTTTEAGKSKPAPDVYLLAANMTGVPPDECVVFEDSPNGLAAGKSAGMFCIGVITDSVNITELSSADCIIKSFDRLTLPQIVEMVSVFSIKK